VGPILAFFPDLCRFSFEVLLLGTSNSSRSMETPASKTTCKTPDQNASKLPRSSNQGMSEKVSQARGAQGITTPRCRTTRVRDDDMGRACRYPQLALKNKVHWFFLKNQTTVVSRILKQNKDIRLKIKEIDGCCWLTPVIPATWEAEIGRITV
jgi:hypothetical protein